ncbi:hypothetical protein K3495_g16445, partial [Podosphaera aphanis]
MMKDGKIVASLIRKYGHIWMTLGHIQSLFIYSDDEPPICYFTEQQLRTIHRRFGHPSATRLWKILKRAGHNPDFQLIERLTKFCRDCQLHSNKPLRYKFSLHKDNEFNHTVYVDILWLEDGPVLHIVDEATSFSAAEWLKGTERESAEEVWNAILRCWINVYTGPPEHLVHDAGKNFSSAAFRKNCSENKIEITEVPVEAHNSVGKVERAHKPLRRAYSIFKEQFSGQGVDRDTLLSMAVKACNDTAGPDGLIPTLCVFGTYPRLTWDDAPAPTAIKRGE